MKETVMDSITGMFTSESVTEGHPDKVADRISDAVLDHCLQQDPLARVACETLVTRDLVVIAGEISRTVSVDAPAIARDIIRGIGYDRPEEGFAADTVEILPRLHHQSQDIAVGVDGGGAGDQGLMFGYACDETPEFFPLPLSLAHRLARQLAEVRRSRRLPWLRPDGKTQVTVRYDKGVPVGIAALVVSTQHEAEVGLATLQEAILREVIAPVVPAGLMGADTHIHINPTGRFVAGGPAADTGLTGRKIIVDSYGGSAPHGGGAFSGKDPSKQDRSAAYMARHIAVSLVAAGLAKRAQIQLAYAIGVAEPVSVLVQTFGTGKKPELELEGIVRRSFDLTPGGIISTLDLRRPIYTAISAYGHFGRSDLDLPWERPARLD
jgi:S-adenosylmethionine synthetase